jgi:hypothetical protein
MLDFIYLIIWIVLNFNKEKISKIVDFNRRIALLVNAVQIYELNTGLL